MNSRPTCIWVTSRSIIPFSKNFFSPFRFVFNHEHCISMVVYIPKRYRSVILLSSSHFTKEIDSDTGDAKKPAMIMDYNATKGGVDTMDENVENFTCRRKTCRWPLLLFYNLLDVSGLNAFILMKKCGYMKSRAEFIRELSLSMATPHMLSRSGQQRVPYNNKCCIRQVLGLELVGAAASASGNVNTPRRCRICKKSSRSSCDVCHRPVCKSHYFVTKVTKCCECNDL